jgi:hypothetical protein
MLSDGGGSFLEWNALQGLFELVSERHFIQCWRRVRLTAQTLANVTLKIEDGIAYPMQIVSHINNVVDDLRYPVDWKAFQVPIRGWGSDTERLLLWQTLADDSQKLEVVQAIICATSWDARNIWGTYVSP